MNKRMMKKIGAWLLLLVVMCSTISLDTLTAEAVTPSNKEYSVEFIQAHSLFMHNAKPIDGEKGTEMYMTYTVKKKTSSDDQMGIVGVEDDERTYPYSKGGLMRYNKGTVDLLEEGFTYFIKCTVASGGFHYDVTKAKGNEAEHIYFELMTGSKVTDKMKYFGIWAAPTVKKPSYVNAILTDIRCYDANGNDLGIEVETKMGGSYILSGIDAVANNKGLDYWYEINVKNKKMLAISNKKPTDSNKITIEYTVESADMKLNQEGLAFSNKPKNGWPHSSGCLKYIGYPQGTKSPLMLVPGAQYVIVIDRTETEFNVGVYRTIKGKTDYFEVAKLSKTYSSTYQFASLWFADELTNTAASFKLTNFKMYDAKGKNLGVQCNKAATIIRKGAPENYEDCEGVYYCEKNEKSFGLYKDKSIKFTDGNGTTDGTYKIFSDEMTVSFSNGKKETYDYLHGKITDADGNEYMRLKSYEINFVTGSDSKVEKQKFSKKEGYIAKRPEDPVKENCTFEGWYDSDGTEYNFDKLVTKSSTLYAKWTGADGVTFLSVDSEDATAVNMTYVFASAGVVLVLAGLLICILLVRKGNKK